MKLKKQKQVQAQPIVEAIPVEEKSKKEFVINCKKCGAALTVKEGGFAFMCPVCKTLFRIRTATRFVKEVAPKEKQVHLTMSERAVNYIIARENMLNEIKPSRQPRRGLESMIARNVNLYDYEEGNALIVDVSEEGGLVVKKS